MENKFGPIEARRKTGSEPFHRDGKNLPFTLLDFWKWSASDLISNTNRGILAEYLVACDLGIAKGIRPEWHPFDLITEDGIQIEVKTSAYLQSWHQRDYSKISFGVAPTLAWDKKTNKYSDERRRQADVYVFCLLAHKEPETLDPMDVDQWRFFVVSKRLLNKEVKAQKSIGLDRLKQLEVVEVAYGQISKAVAQVMQGT